jgi:SAM-dependent methyltransferase
MRMNKYLLRSATLLLVPCLVADPVTASAFLTTINPARLCQTVIFQTQAINPVLAGSRELGPGMDRAHPPFIETVRMVESSVATDRRLGGDISKGFSEEEKHAVFYRARIFDHHFQVKGELLMEIARHLFHVRLESRTHLGMGLEIADHAARSLLASQPFPADHSRTWADVIEQAVEFFVGHDLSHFSREGTPPAVFSQEKYLLANGTPPYHSGVRPLPLTPVDRQKFFEGIPDVALAKVLADAFQRSPFPGVFLVSDFFNPQSILYPFRAQAVFHEIMEAVTPQGEMVHHLLILFAGRYFPVVAMRQALRAYIDASAEQVRREADAERALPSDTVINDLLNRKATPQTLRYYEELFAEIERSGNQIAYDRHLISNGLRHSFPSLRTTFFAPQDLERLLGQVLRVLLGSDTSVQESFQWAPRLMAILRERFVHRKSLDDREILSELAPLTRETNQAALLELIQRAKEVTGLAKGTAAGPGQPIQDPEGPKRSRHPVHNVIDRTHPGAADLFYHGHRPRFATGSGSRTVPQFWHHYDTMDVPYLPEEASEIIQQKLEPLLPPGGRILDLMTGAYSHIPPRIQSGRIVGLGLTEAALRQNSLLNEFIVHDVNANPRLPLPDHNFDAVTLVSGMAYVQQPVELLEDVARILRPGGLLAIVFGIVSFFDQTDAAWYSLDEDRRVDLVKAYLLKTGKYQQPRADWFKFPYQEYGERRAHEEPLWMVWAFTENLAHLTIKSDWAHRAILRQAA